MRRSVRSACSAWFLHSGRFLLAAVLLVSVARGQQPFLEYPFESEDELLDFFAPPGGVFCNGAALVLGTAAVEDGELVLTNGAAGASIAMLLPDVVGDAFPDDRDYRLRMRVNFESHSGIFYVFLRTRMQINLDFNLVDISDELGYPVYLDLQSQMQGVIEEQNCNLPAPHPDWPDSNGTWSVRPSEFPIELGADIWYWMETTVEGEDDGGPVELTARFWPDGEEPPAEPQFVMEDPDGLSHTETTRLPDREVQILFLNLFGAPDQVMRIDDVTLTSLNPPGLGPFIRGDSNNDGNVDITDGVTTLNWLFLGGLEPPCKEAAEISRDGMINLTDAVAIFNFLFLGDAPPDPPYPKCAFHGGPSVLGCTTPTPPERCPP